MIATAYTSILWTVQSRAVQLPVLNTLYTEGDVPRSHATAKFTCRSKVELNPICHLLVLLGDLTFMGPCIVPIYVYNQQDATLHSIIISGNCSTCFGWYFHPP
jgi:hypothetical protein